MWPPFITCKLAIRHLTIVKAVSANPARLVAYMAWQAGGLIMFKDIMVHLDGTAEDESRLGFAESLVHPLEGHITGIYSNLLPDSAWMGATEASGTVVKMLMEMEDQARAEGDKKSLLLSERLAKLAAVSELRRVEAGAYQITRAVASLARTADVFVMSRPHGAKADERWTDLLETVLFDSGRAIIAVPPGYKKFGPIRRILVTWQDNRETTRALHEALPLIGRAAATRLLIVDDEKKRIEAREAPAADIARHLHRHGATVEVSEVDLPGRSVSDRILKAADEFTPDIIVMGGYGHSRFREWILGGTTRDMLTRCEIPLFIAH
eukprot:gene17315-17506_t